LSQFQNPVIRQDHDFGTATLDLREKSGFDRFFQEPVPKLTEF
jgi:hypothetical protein